MPNLWLEIVTFSSSLTFLQVQIWKDKANSFACEMAKYVHEA